MTHGSVAAKVRMEKEAHPERFCPDRKCLWRVQTSQGPNPCRKHPHLQPKQVKSESLSPVEG